MASNHLKVPTGLKVRTQLMTVLKPLYLWLGQVESWFLKDELANTVVTKPVYVNALPRSGTTIISEILSQHHDTCHHQYGDFPNVFTPYWKRWLKQRNPVKSEQYTERSHGDRIMVNQQSIDAFEEVIWQAFFKNIHQQNRCQIPDPWQHPPFIDFYTDHIKKMILVTGQTRYICKNNYNINRMLQILDLFPDAKFIIPIRHPINHVASMLKQHNKFLQAGKHNPDIDRQLAASGHFEFGRLRELISFGDQVSEQNVLNHFEDLMGWARYWAYYYKQVHQLINSNLQLQSSVLMFRYEDLCFDTATTLEKIFAHCALNHSNYSEIQSQYENVLTVPTYYSVEFSDEQKTDIMHITEEMATLFGYNLNNHF